MTKQSHFSSVIAEWPFQDNLLSRTVLTHRALSLETSTETMLSVITQCPAILRPSPMYKLHNLGDQKVTV